MYGKSRRTHRREAFVPQHHPCRIPGTNTWQAGIKNGLKVQGWFNNKTPFIGVNKKSDKKTTSLNKDNE